MVSKIILNNYNLRKRCINTVRLRECIHKNKIPKKLILCHGHLSPSYNFIKNKKNILFLDIREEIQPDIIFNINSKKINLHNNLRFQFTHITSIYAPIYLFFDSKVDYRYFKNTKSNIKREYYYNIFKNIDGKIDYNKIKNSNIYFDERFIKTILFLLELDGSMEFTDNFIYTNKDNCSLDNNEVIKIFEYFLGKYKNYFKINITDYSSCIDIEQRALYDNSKQKFVKITKIKNFYNNK
jgi:hypothetical protein